eukprot:CAMPEP_0181203892 /NCGR_PEP_ID=MMETSP1096-20121128/19639_1 /TAXON_ID=156174 ORGANISM="Chrysochromulina ericina, Strain CCMP281" /NCGR_SAMPLE_ID=MMETSP1096 /ASSEMBLY_ACC=CAM_ASM_000453 /LENGTH=93 /DNA_ID=CAMNT_0023294545 /DNA_START=977 /DNA_END=1258 /DNA_ORIENTATION=+
MEGRTQATNVLDCSRVELDEPVVVLDSQSERIVTAACQATELIKHRRHAPKGVSPVHPSSATLVLKQHVTRGAAAILVKVPLNDYYAFFRRRD